MATTITDTNSLNFVSFNAEFTSGAGAHGLLTVYWDTNMIGELDEANVQPGMQHYYMAFQDSLPNSAHVLGFHVDPFSQIHSSMILTNIVVGCSGAAQSAILTISTNRGLAAYQLLGQPGTYAVQASSDLLNWTNILYLINTNGSVDFSDQSEDGYIFRFYRSISQMTLGQ